MGGFTLIRDYRSPTGKSLEAKQLAAMGAQGFANPKKVLAGENALFLYPKQVATVTNVLTFPNGDFVAICGTFYYKAKTECDGLEAIYRDFSPPQFRATRIDAEPLPSPIRGTYVCVVYKSASLWLFTDRIGFYKVYEACRAKVLTSSFLTALACTPEPRLHSQCIYEYVFQGATYGGETVIDGVELLSSDAFLEFDQSGSSRYRRPDLAAPVVEDISLDNHCERINAELNQVFDECAQAFGRRIDTALSGGYDSRLILAHLLSRDVTPNIHVYGGDHEDDVQVAKSIAAGEGFSLNHVDKARYKHEGLVEDEATIIERNFQTFDGLPPDGIFDSGIDLTTRRDRAAGGSLALNGGGGEIFRNFFYLRNRQYSPRDIVWAFYSQFDPRCFTKGQDAKKYQDRLAEKIAATSNASDRRLSRAEVERVFPLFRCRYWMGKNNSINNRIGLMHTPLVEPHLVELAGAVPISLKNGGRLAASLIRRVSPRLAKYQSAYGYPFISDPPWSRVLKESLNSFRPPFVRRFSFPLKSIMASSQCQPIGRKRGESQYESLLFQGKSVLESFLRTEKLWESRQRGRAMTLSYLIQRFGIN